MQFNKYTYIHTDNGPLKETGDLLFHYERNKVFGFSSSSFTKIYFYLNSTWYVGTRSYICKVGTDSMAVVGIDLGRDGNRRGKWGGGGGRGAREEAP